MKYICRAKHIKGNVSWLFNKQKGLDQNFCYKLILENWTLSYLLCIWFLKIWFIQQNKILKVLHFEDGNFNPMEENRWKIPLFGNVKKSGYFIGLSATLSRGAELRLALCRPYWTHIYLRLIQYNVLVHYAKEQGADTIFSTCMCSNTLTREPS